jgi:hypothetical protein
MECKFSHGWIRPIQIKYEISHRWTQMNTDKFNEEGQGRKE